MRYYNVLITNPNSAAQIAAMEAQVDALSAQATAIFTQATAAANLAVAQRTAGNIAGYNSSLAQAKSLDAQGKQILQQAHAIRNAETGLVTKQYTSVLPNGKSDPNALLVEMDIPVSAFATPYGSAFVRIWGVSIQDISQASDLNGFNIQVFGGMQKGLPLANPAQSGLLVEGVVQQAFGNWQGVNMTLDIIITTGTGSAKDPKNLVFDWKAGTPMATAIANTLKTAFPTYTQTININPNLVLSNDEPGYCQTAEQFALYVKGISQNIIGGAYPGVDILVKEKAFIVYDGSTQTTPKQLLFTDLIGQPTWTGFNQINVSCVMRADINVGDYVKLPPTVASTTSQSYSQYRSNSVFQGVFFVGAVRHVGNSRQPDGASWITTLYMNTTA
jgi:hypothetical protein